MKEHGQWAELAGHDYVMDLIADLELMRDFPKQKSYFIISAESSTRTRPNASLFVILIDQRYLFFLFLFTVCFFLFCVIYRYILNRIVKFCITSEYEWLIQYYEQRYTISIVYCRHWCFVLTYHSALFGSGFDSDDETPLFNPPMASNNLPDSDGYYSHGQMTILFFAYCVLSIIG